jgi:hypothetical protein
MYVMPPQITCLIDLHRDLKRVDRYGAMEGGTASHQLLVPFLRLSAITDNTIVLSGTRQQIGC